MALAGLPARQAASCGAGASGFSVGTDVARGGLVPGFRPRNPPRRAERARGALCRVPASGAQSPPRPTSHAEAGVFCSAVT